MGLHLPPIHLPRVHLTDEEKTLLRIVGDAFGAVASDGRVDATDLPALILAAEQAVGSLRDHHRRVLRAPIAPPVQPKGVDDGS